MNHDDFYLWEYELYASPIYDLLADELGDPFHHDQ